ncbi:MAG: DinB family protein [Gemmatimonadetes bacterium]|nr:DinB family protein [Gemmatimonadota bacterium]
MDETMRSALWGQFGAAIDMLGNAIDACPDDAWADDAWVDDGRQAEFWAVAFHTLFWLDLYLSPTREGFAPPAPFGLEELSYDGRPPRAYTKDEVRAYLTHCRAKCWTVIDTLTTESAAETRPIGRIEGSVLEMLLYNLRHVQHHAGQLNLMLRQATGTDAPRWVSRAIGEPAGA